MRPHVLHGRSSVRAAVLLLLVALGCDRAKVPARADSATPAASSAADSGARRSDQSSVVAIADSAEQLADAQAADTAAPTSAPPSGPRRVPAQICAAGEGARAGWGCAEWDIWDAPHARDLGTGVVIFAPNHEGYSDPTRLYVDTLVFRDAPSADAPVVGALIQSAGDSVTPARVAVAAPGRVTANLEATYQSQLGANAAGVPVDSTDASGTWLRAIFAFDSLGAALRGWTTLRDDTLGTVRHVVWATHMPETTQPLSFVDARTARLYDRPGDRGKPGRAHALPPDADGWEMTVAAPAQVRGRWLRVRVVTPYDMCGESEAKQREYFYWIPYLDERGRPLVSDRSSNTEC